MTPLLPPKLSVSGWYWLAIRGGLPAMALWKPHYKIWTSPDNTDWSPEALAREGYTLASPHRIPTSEQMDAVHALTADLKPPQRPAGEFALGYITGMEYAARKLREALGVTL